MIQVIDVEEGSPEWFAARAGIPCVGLVDTNSDPTTVSHPVPGNDDAVKSIRIIVEAVTAAIQSGLALRDTRRAQRGAADIKSAQPTVGVPSAEGVDFSKVEIPAAIAAVVEGDVEPVVVAKKPVRAKKAAVKAK